jgi:hypothetical protein
VLGEVRRKLQDCQKLQELIKSLVKLRELRKSEGEKKGLFKHRNIREKTIKQLNKHEITFSYNFSKLLLAYNYRKWLTRNTIFRDTIY